jgi:hypothetical protein
MLGEDAQEKRHRFAPGMGVITREVVEGNFEL